MNIIHEFRPTEESYRLEKRRYYASIEEATKALTQAQEELNSKLSRLERECDRIQDDFWNIGNVIDSDFAPIRQELRQKVKPMIQENEMTIVQKAVIAVLLLWSISVTVHLCFQDKSFTDGFFWKYCFSGIVTFLLVQLVFLTANRRAAMIAVKKERDAARSRLRQIRELVTTGEESVDYRSQSVMNSPLIKQIADIAQ